MIRKKLDIKSIILTGIIILISLNFIPTGDDYFFINLQYDSFLDLFNDMKNGTLMMNDGSYLLTHNGRYLGNFLGITVSKMAIHPSLYLVRSLIMGVGIVIVAFLCSKLTIYNQKNSYFYSTILLLMAPVGVYREVYAWTAGYMNYLIPIIPLLICLIILRNFLVNSNNISSFKIVILIFCGFTTQLFMEHITIYMVILSLFILVFCYMYSKEKIKITLSFFVSTLIGAIVMFSNSGYRAVVDSSDTYRSIATGLKELILKIISNGYEMSKFIVTDNLFLTIIILIICITLLSEIHLKNNNKFNRINILLSVFVIIYILGINMIEMLRLNTNFGSMGVCLSVIIGMIFIEIVLYTLITSIKDKKVKIDGIFYILSIIILIIPLTIVSPIGTRCFFICYVFMVIITLNLLYYIKENNLIVFSKVKFFMIIICCLIIFNKIMIFCTIKNIYDERTGYILQEMKKGEKTIKIPSLPFKNYIQNDTDVFLSQYYYYEEIGDISFIAMEYDEWKKFY